MRQKQDEGKNEVRDWNEHGAALTEWGSECEEAG